VEDATEFAELEVANLLAIPFFALLGKIFEFLIAFAAAEGDGEQTVAEADGRFKAMGKALVKRKEGIKAIFEAHDAIKR
jgi:hypothetical protein